MCMTRKIVYGLGAPLGLLLLFVFVIPPLFQADPQSSVVLMAEDALYKKVSTGFYAVDALTKDQIPFAKIVVRLKYDNDPDEKRLVTVNVQTADKNGWVQVSGLEPNTTVVDTYDESKSNRYVVFACDTAKPFAKRYGRLDSMGTFGPGHYDSFTIELRPVSDEGEIRC